MSSLGDKKHRQQQNERLQLQPSVLVQVSPNEARSESLIDNFLKLLKYLNLYTEQDEISTDV